jgi:hypothetical protein
VPFGFHPYIILLPVKIRPEVGNRILVILPV